ncbi:MAG: 50S ribosomal protein L22 [Patescibacteria group bacterium]
MTQIKAQLNGLRISPRKVRLLVGLIKRKDVQAALDQLAHMAKRPSVPLVKLLESAVANAENTYKLNRDTLFIKEMTVDDGVKLKRYRPKGFGRTSPIEKKTSRISVVLESREPKVEVKKPEAKIKANK